MKVKNISGIKNLNYWADRINKAKSKEDLTKITFDYFVKDAKSFMDDRIDSLAVYKEQILNGASKEELKQAINSLELPKNVMNLIK